MERKLIHKIFCVKQNNLEELKNKQNPRETFFVFTINNKKKGCIMNTQKFENNLFQLEVKTEADGTPKIVMNTKWTQKGHLFIYDFLKKHDVLPSIETLFE